MSEQITVMRDTDSSKAIERQTVDILQEFIKLARLLRNADDLRAAVKTMEAIGEGLESLPEDQYLQDSWREWMAWACASIDHAVTTIPRTPLPDEFKQDLVN